VGLLVQLACVFTMRRVFSCDGGAQESHLPVLFRYLGLELVRLGQLRVDADAPRQRGGGALGLGFWGASPSHAPVPFTPSACSSATTTKHSHEGS
jgi:hypothetical protein